MRKSTKPVKLSERQLADKYSLSKYAVRTAREAGVDVHDPEQVREHFLKVRRRPDKWVNGCPWDQDKKQAETVKVAASSTELDMIEMIENATDYDTARTLKTKVDSLYKMRQIQIQDREYIHRDEVTDDMTRIGNGLKAGLLRLQADLPPMLEGLQAADMQKVIAEKIHEALTQWADESSELYQEEVV